MTPQSSFFVLAPVTPQREAELRGLLAAMNDGPGRLRADGAIPFSQLEKLHYARLLIVDDKTVGDNQVYGVPPPVYPLYLVFLGDVDGDGDAFLADAASQAAAGLSAVFSCCDGFTPGQNLLAWMRAWDGLIGCFFIDAGLPANGAVSLRSWQRRRAIHVRGS